MRRPTLNIPVAVLGIIGVLSVGSIAACSSVLGRDGRWFSGGVANALRILGWVFLAAGGLAITILLVFAVANLLARISARYPEPVPRGRDRHEL
jgi:hypothetical protein